MWGVIIVQNLESSSKLGAFSNGLAEEVDDVDESDDAERDETNDGETPLGGQAGGGVGKEGDTTVGETSGDEEGGDEESGDNRADEVWVGIYDELIYLGIYRV